MEENLSRLESKGIVSPQKFREAEGKIEKAKAPMENLLAQLSGISSTKSDSESRAVAAQALQTLQSFLQTNNPLAQQLPDAKSFKLPNRNSKDEVKSQDVPDASALLQEGLLPDPPEDDNQPDTIPDPLPKPAPPTAADLAPTLDVQITPEIIAEANALGNDPAREYKFVHDTIFFEPYFGSQKGSLRTLLSKAGNDMDQCSLLIALLRASGIPARYETGAVQIRIPKLENWLGITDPATAFYALLLNGYPSSAVWHGGKIAGAIFQHVWVVVFVGGHFYRLDPSFKRYDVVAPADVIQDSGFGVSTAQATLEQGVVVDNTLPTFTGGNFAGLQQLVNRAATTMAGVLQTTPNPYGSFTPISIRPRLSHHLPLRARSFLGAFPEVPDYFRFTVTFYITNALYRIPPATPGITFPTVSLTNKRLAFESNPATSQDAAIIQAVGGIFNVIPAYLVNMKFALKVEDRVAYESPVTAPLGGFVYLVSQFSEPSFTDDFNAKPLIGGATYAASIGVERTTFDPSLQARIQTLQSERASGPLTTSSQIEEILYVTAMTYFLFTDEESEGVARFANITWTRLPEEAVTAQDLAIIFVLGLPYQVLPGGFDIDVKRNVVTPFSRAGIATDVPPWIIGVGADASGFEGFINQNLHGVTSISTMELLSLAQTGGTPTHIIVPNVNLDNQLSHLNIDLSVESFIASFVNAGFTVIVPHQNLLINQWNGVGILAFDPASGSSGFFIVGGIQAATQFAGGATTSAAPDAWTTSAMGPDLTLVASEKDALDSGGGAVIKPSTVNKPEYAQAANLFGQCFATLTVSGVGLQQYESYLLYTGASAGLTLVRYNELTLPVLATGATFCGLGWITDDAIVTFDP